MIDRKELIKKTKSHNWWIECSPGSIQIAGEAWKCFVNQGYLLGTGLLSFFFVGIKKGIAYEISSADEKWKIYLHIFESMKKNNNYIKEYIKFSRKRAKKCDVYIDSVKNYLESLSNKDLFDKYAYFNNIYSEYVEFPAAAESLDIMIEFYAKDMLRKELSELDEKEFEKAFDILTAVPFISFLEKAKKELLEITLRHKDDLLKNNLNKKLLSDFQKHSNKNFFIETSFKSQKHLSTNDFIKLAKKELQRPAEELITSLDEINNKIDKINAIKNKALKKYHLSEDMLLHIQIIEQLGSFVDERKGVMIKYSYHIFEFCKEIAKRLSIELEEVMFYTQSEIREILLKNSKPNPKLAKDREEVSMYLYYAGPDKCIIELLEQDLANEIFDIVMPEIKDRNNVIIKGRVVYNSPKYLEGKVQIIMDPHLEKLEKGRILVTTMTRPEFIHVMREALAIITDEGGITCHAAILSREMKKPCIVSTKNASRILKTGDNITMNLETGEIKILENE